MRSRPPCSARCLLKFSAEEGDWIAGSRDPARSARPTHEALGDRHRTAPTAWPLVAWAARPARGGLQAGGGRYTSPGAGDAFLAGLLHALCPGSEAAHCCPKTTTAIPMGDAAGHAFGSCLRGLVCAGSGAPRAQPSAAEVEPFLQQFLQTAAGRNPEKSAGVNQGHGGLRLHGKFHRQASRGRPAQALGPFSTASRAPATGLLPLLGEQLSAEAACSRRWVKMDEMG